MALVRDGRADNFGNLAEAVLEPIVVYATVLGYTYMKLSFSGKGGFLTSSFPITLWRDYCARERKWLERYDYHLTSIEWMNHV